MARPKTFDEQENDNSEAPPPAAAKAPAVERRTPAQWAAERGHVNAKPKGSIRPGARTMRAWIYDSTKVHAGWGKRVAADVQLTGDEYDAAVNAAVNVTLA